MDFLESWTFILPTLEKRKTTEFGGLITMNITTKYYKYLLFSLLIGVFSQAGGWASVYAAIEIFPSLSPVMDLSGYSYGCAPNTFMAVRAHYGVYPVNDGSPFTSVSGSPNSSYPNNYNLPLSGFDDSQPIRWVGLYCGPDAFSTTLEYYFNYNVDEVTFTRIITVDPSDGEVLATSSPTNIGATGFISDDDFVDGMVFRQNLFLSNAPIGGGFIVGPADALFQLQQNQTFEYEIDSSGLFDFSTTTQFTQIGQYNLKSEIVIPVFSIFGFSFGQNTIVSTSTIFLVATSSQGDLINDNFVGAVNDFTEQIALSCEINFSSLFSLSNLTDCVKAIVYFSGSEISDGLNNTVQVFIHKAPWGYATRVYEIITASSTPETLPSLSISMPAGLPVSGTLDLTPWDDISSAFTQIDEAEVETIEGSPLDKFLFYWNTLWYIVFGLWLLKTLHSAFEFGDLGHKDSDMYTVHRGGMGDKYTHEFSYLRKKKK